MRDFPVFTTDNGVGSLILKEIPYNATAYIIIRSSACPTDFLEECTAFCRAVGAQKVYASGSDCLEKFPYFTSVVRMAVSKDSLLDTDACLFPVTEHTARHWQDIYNDKMKGVHNAAYMSDSAMQELLQRGGAYYVHADETLLGIGIVRDDRIECVASAVPGRGREVVLALAHALICDRILLEVASTNTRAVHLYESMGFVKTAELSKWYEII